MNSTAAVAAFSGRRDMARRAAEVHDVEGRAVHCPVMRRGASALVRIIALPAASPAWLSRMSASRSALSRMSSVSSQ
jgi:hypothetical protein